jgi:type I restriction enzyme S subunit
VGPEVPADTIFNDHLIRARLREGLDPQFARLCLGLPAARAVIEEAAATSAGQLTIGQQTLNAIEIPDLALSDQRRIARELKAQLAVVEEARRAAQAQVEDAALLTGAILRDAFAALEEVPREPIGRIARTCSGTTPSRSRPDYWAPAVYPWIKTGEVANAPIRTSEEAISARALHECSLSLLPPGTVLVAMYGQGKTRGQSAVLEVAATTNQACFAILPGERLIPQYLQFWLRHSYQALRSLSEGRGGNQANLNGEMLNAFEVPLPALDEQRRIAAHLSAAIAAAEDACAQIAAHQKAIELLPARLLAQAFQQEEPELCC